MYMYVKLLAHLVHHLTDKVYVHDLNCHELIEILYYSAKYKPICIYCRQVKLSKNDREWQGVPKFLHAKISRVKISTHCSVTEFVSLPCWCCLCTHLQFCDFYMYVSMLYISLLMYMFSLLLCLGFVTYMYLHVHHQIIWESLQIVCTKDTIHRILRSVMKPYSAYQPPNLIL